MAEALKSRVIVADDQEIIADTLAIILNQSGFEATAVYSGETAVETARRFHPNFLISDIVMQGMTGIDAAIRVRETDPDCRVILFSGQIDIEGLIQAAESNGHFFEVLDKPVQPEIFLQRLSAL